MKALLTPARAQIPSLGDTDLPCPCPPKEILSHLLAPILPSLRIQQYEEFPVSEAQHGQGNTPLTSSDVSSLLRQDPFPKDLIHGKCHPLVITQNLLG